MFILYLVLAGDNRQQMQELLVALSSLLLILFFVYILPHFIEKNYEKNWLVCVVFSAIGFIYSFVEMIAFAVAADTDFKSVTRFIGPITFITCGLVFLFGTIYTYAYIVKRSEQKIVESTYVIKDNSQKILDAFPYGGITTTYNVYSTLMIWLSSFIGFQMVGFRNHIQMLIPFFIFIFMIFPLILGWILSRTLPRKHYLKKIEEIVNEHNKDIAKN